MNRWKSISIVFVASVTMAPSPVSTEGQSGAPTVQQVPSTAPQAPQVKKGPVTITLPKGAVIGIRLDNAVSSETARVEEKITGKVSRDVIVEGTTAIAAGTRIEGTVVQVDRPSSKNPRGKIGIKFTTLVRADNTQIAIVTDAITREAPDAPSPSSLDVNAFGAVIGASRQTQSGRAGSPSPSPSPSPSRSRDVRIPAGAVLTVHLTTPVSVTIVRDPQ